MNIQRSVRFMLVSLDVSSQEHYIKRKMYVWGSAFEMMRISNLIGCNRF
jgi:hypothetical protein